MKKHIIESLQIGWRGAIAGVVVAILYMLASTGAGFHLATFLYFLLFGVIAGFCIALVIVLSDKLCQTYLSGLGNYLVILQLVMTYILSAIVFLGVTFLLGILLLGYYPPMGKVLGESLWTGIASIVVALVFKVIEEKEEKLRLEKENRELAVMEERSRIARELHDSVSQNLFGISLNLKSLEYLSDKDPEGARRIIGLLDSMVQEVQTEMRLMIYELRPVSLENRNLYEALENLADLYRKRFKLELSCCLSGSEESLDNETRTALYRITQEALNNIVKHSKSAKADLMVEIKAGKGNLTVRDYGVGFDPAHAASGSGIGLASMRERAEKIGGTFAIASSERKGTTITVSL